MSDLLFLILCLIALAIVTFLIFLIYSGLLHSVNVRTEAPPIQQCLFAYKTWKGPYKDVGRLFMEAAGIAPEEPCVGIYYDDPEQVKLRSLAL